MAVLPPEAVEAAEPRARRPAEVGARVESLEHELKFTLPQARVPIVLRWLRSVCRPDETYAPAFVWSIYYDTATWRALAEKLNSDYLKTKVRLRWYSAFDAPPGDGPSFAEAKFRVGSRREKVRVRTTWPASWLSAAPLEDPELWRLADWVRPHGVLLHEVHHPMLTIRYRRYRFVEPVSGTRISLDTDILVPAANRRFVSSSNRAPLPVAVVEVKGTTTELPRALHALVHLGCRRRSFSKYSAAYQHLTRNQF